ncbi:MAG: hypothetical protein JWN94_2842 [Betaproteobacteria bacterium]|nr:hypothetical protein [Betaproteobacteria bacterium]
MLNSPVALLIAVAAIGGLPSGASADMLSATRTVIAIVADELYIGEAVGHLSGAGTLMLRSQSNPAVSCRGEFTSNAAQSGSGQLACSDGTAATFQFKRLSTFTGFGAGNSALSSLSFVYGLGPIEAAAYLKLPPGKKLTHDGAQLALADL